MEPKDKHQENRADTLCPPPAPDGMPQTSDPSVKGLALPLEHCDGFLQISLMVVGLGCNTFLPNFL